MQEFLKLFPQRFYEIIGLAVVISGLGIIWTLITEGTKKIVWRKNGRRDTNFIHDLITVQHTFSDQVLKFTEQVSNMSKNLEKVSTRALLDHERIIDKIDELNVPRHHSRG